MIRYYWDHYFSPFTTERPFESIFRGWLIGMNIAWFIIVITKL